MKLRHKLLFVGVLAAGAITTGCSKTETDEAKAKSTMQPLKTKVDVSLVLEAKASISRGVDYLISTQMENGAWMNHPAVTSLCALSIANNPDGKKAKAKMAIEKARKFILSNVQKDGSIWNKKSEEYPNYSTSISLVTLAYLNHSEDEKVVREARKFLIDSQFNDVSVDNPSYGGIGYSENLRPDLSNTQLALEALYLTNYMDREPNVKSPADAQKAEKMWTNAVKFLSRCQSLKGTNDQGWVTNDPKNKGSFIYIPANKDGNPQSKIIAKTLKGYGSMTYAGLKSMLYCKLKKDDPRVQAAFEWAQKNYTMDSNPGLGLQGHFYYLHTFAKAMTALGEDTITDSKGKVHNWREDMIKKFLSVQKGNGQWVNTEGRWWENQPNLVTAYALLSLEQTVGNDVATLIKRMK